MGIGQVRDVHEIAHAGAVGRRIVVAKHRERRPAAHRRYGAGNQVFLRVVVLANQTVGVGAGRVEIPQGRPLEAIRALEVRQRALNGQLGFAVRVDGLLRVRFVDLRPHRLAERRTG